MKVLILVLLGLFISSMAYAQEPPRYTSPGSDVKEVLEQEGGGEGKGVLVGARGIAVKGGQGKNTAALPDVCLTPPSTPGGAQNREGPDLADAGGKGRKSTKSIEADKIFEKEPAKQDEASERAVSRRRGERERIKRIPGNTSKSTTGKKIMRSIK